MNAPNPSTDRALAHQQVREASAEPASFVELLEHPSWREKIASKLPSTMTMDRLKGVVITAFNKQPKLLACTPISMYQALTECATTDLWPGPQGHAYLIPYGNKRKGPDGKDLIVGNQPVWENCAQFMLGYRGMMDLAYRGGLIEPGSFQASAIYEHDDFDLGYGSESFIKHRPKILGDRGKPIGYYAVCRPKGGRPVFDVMRKDEVDAIRARSKSSNFGPWVTDYDAMACKTVIRRFWKMLPSSVTANFADLIERDMEREFDLMSERPKREKVDRLTGEVRQKQPTWTPEQTSALDALRQRVKGDEAMDQAFQARWRDLKYSDPTAALGELEVLVTSLEEAADSASAAAPAPVSPATVADCRAFAQRILADLGEDSCDALMDPIMEHFEIGKLPDLPEALARECMDLMTASYDAMTGRA